MSRSRVIVCQGCGADLELDRTPFGGYDCPECDKDA